MRQFQQGYDPPFQRLKQPGTGNAGGLKGGNYLTDNAQGHARRLVIQIPSSASCNCPARENADQPAWRVLFAAVDRQNSDDAVRVHLLRGPQGTNSYELRMTGTVLV